MKSQRPWTHVLDRRDLDSAGVYQVPLGCVLKRTHSESGMDVHYQGQTILKKHLFGGPSDAQYFTQEYLESLANGGEFRTVFSGPHPVYTVYTLKKKDSWEARMVDEFYDLAEIASVLITQIIYF